MIFKEILLDAIKHNYTNYNNLFISWNAIKDKQIREIIDIRKSLFFR